MLVDDEELRLVDSFDQVSAATIHRCICCVLNLFHALAELPQTRPHKTTCEPRRSSIPLRRRC